MSRIGASHLLSRSYFSGLQIKDNLNELYFFENLTGDRNKWRQQILIPDY